MQSTIKTRFATTRPAIAASIAAIALILGAGSAQASDPNQALTKTVSYGDLNLDTESGAKLLYVRLRDAAKEVCSPYQSTELSRKRVWAVCVSSALAGAADQINKPMLTALIVPGANRITG
ncbi:MAG TPA: UrcA family protein [Steroidobacteraceae bacterium]